jgi:hypothetical protein
MSLIERAASMGLGLGTTFGIAAIAHGGKPLPELGRPVVNSRLRTIAKRSAVNLSRVKIYNIYLQKFAMYPINPYPHSPFLMMSS